MERMIQESFVTNLAFTDLPPEVRLMIYPYLLRPRDKLVIEETLFPGRRVIHDLSNQTGYPFRQQFPQIKSPSAYATYNRGFIAERYRYGELLKICTKVLVLNRQVRDEALKSLYGQHLDFACSPEGLEAFLNDRPAMVLEWITNITLEVPSDSGWDKFKAVCSFIAREVRLKKLGVRINTFWWQVQPFEETERLRGNNSIARSHNTWLMDSIGQRNGEGAVEDLLKLAWAQSLLLIKELDSLDIEFDTRYAAKKLTCGAGFTRLLRTRMLKDKPHNKAQMGAQLQGDTHDADDAVARQ
ncbi:MAG: hypothetical protein Q9208_000166 [Pyrenodesmia sp. 3 TL-2023]